VRTARVAPPRLEEIAARSDEEGDLATTTGMRLLYRYSVGRANGLLLVSAAGVRKEIYFTAGTPLFVSSNATGELLGEHLVAQKVLSAGELAMALAMMPHYGGKLGDTLVGLGLMKPLDVFRHLTRQVQSKLVDVCTWERGMYGWYEHQRNPREAFPLDLEPYVVLGAGAMAMPGPRVASWCRRRADLRLVKVDPPKIGVGAFRLGAEAELLWRSLDGTRTLMQLALGRAQGDPRDNLLRMCFLFVHTQLVRDAPK
jgi:eukaryotic-like serine/threonine-protein kinase